MTIVTPLPVRPRAADSLQREASPRAEEVERHSLVAILELIRRGHASTRQELEAASALGRNVVADRVATLTRLGLVEPGEPGPSAGGRAPKTVRFKAGAGQILVANLERSAIGVGLADLNGRVVFEHHEAAEVMEGPELILARLQSLFDWVLEQQDEPASLWGISLGVPGAVDVEAEGAFSLQRLNFAPSWAGSLAAERLMMRHRTPVWVRSGFQMATMGELGPPRPGRAHSSLFAELGEELCAGLAVGGRVVVGAHGIAGQIGHTPAEGAKLVCRCGNAGCLETVAGARAILGDAIAAASEGRSGRLADLLAANGVLEIADIGLAAQLGDAAAAGLLARAGALIGTGLASLINAFNPASVILGGELSQTGDIMLAAVREAIYRHSHPLATRDLQIVRSTMGRSAALAGAALVASGALFEAPLLGEWVGFGNPVHHPAVIALLERAAVALGAASDAR